MKPDQPRKNIKMNHEEIWFWYCQVTEWEKSRISARKWAQKNNLNEAKFQHLKTKFRFCKDSNPAKYQKYIVLAQEYIACDIDRVQFCQINSCSENIIGECVTHLTYLDIVESMRASGASLEPPRPKGVEWVPIHIKKTKKSIVKNENDEINFFKVTRKNDTDNNKSLTTSEDVESHAIAPTQINTLLEPEMPHPKNLIEIGISKGVKIQISPEISSDKILLIINLLKDI